MITARDLHKSYPTRFGEKVVLDGINFELAKGQRLGILGRNGAGKSTLVRLISGAERPTSGEIVRSMSVSWPLAFGGAFQTDLTGVDNIRFITTVYGQDFERNLAFVEDFAELGRYLKEPVRTYSSGMRARLAFAISMIIEFDCFLIDEIGAVGDARFHDRCEYELFEKRADRSMVIISHDAAYLRDHCNRWAILNEGKLSLYTGFEQAYSAYRELVSRQVVGSKPRVSLADRGRLIDTSQTAALADEEFRIHVHQGDWARDRKDWVTSMQEYRAALEIYPYQRSYWVQLGHVTKEAEDFVSAELAYRTAVALGEPVADVAEFIDFVSAQSTIDLEESELAVPGEGPVPEQPAAQPDIMLFAWLFWSLDEVAQETALGLLKGQGTLDRLAAAMIADDRFMQVHGDWIAGVGQGIHTAAEVGGAANSPFSTGTPSRSALLCSILAPERLDPRNDAVPTEPNGREGLLAFMVDRDAFATWPNARHSLLTAAPELAPFLGERVEEDA